MEFLVIYLLAMTAPGAVLSGLLHLDENRAAVSIALSISVLVLLLTAARVLGLGATGFGYLLCGAYVAVAGIGALYGRHEWLGRALVFHFDRIWLIPLATFAAVIGYMAWAGPYTEVPADAWWHIGRINEWLERSSAGAIGAGGSLENLVGEYAEPWYAIAGFFLSLTQDHVESGLSHLALANTLLFSLAVYSFALFVFKHVVETRWTRHWIAAAAVFFFFTHFGISVFSYVRYYVYAPGVLNYVVYLSAVACLVGFLGRDSGGYRFLVAAGLFELTAALIDIQEALFVVVMAAGIVLVEMFRASSLSIRRSTAEEGNGEQTRGNRLKAIFWAGICIYVIVHVTAYMTMPRENPLQHRLMADIRNYLPFLQNLFILRPTGQFYQVVTGWGVLVYGLFIVNRDRFIRTPYLTAAAVIPLLTVFNPVFTDLFLRFSNPTVLWRMCFMLPLPFLGGFFLVKYLEQASTAPGLRARLGGILVAGGLVLLLLPINSTYVAFPYSKVYTLGPVDKGNDYRLWNDLLAFLKNQDKSGIITDRVTGYVINGLTAHKYRGYKFYDLYSSHVARDTYDGQEFQASDGWKRLVKRGEFESNMDWLVVINQRDGSPSEAGRYGGHWPQDIMKVSNLYSQAFLEYVKSRPEMFEEIWNQNNIAVYRVVGV